MRIPALLTPNDGCRPARNHVHFLPCRGRGTHLPRAFHVEAAGRRNLPADRDETESPVRKRCKAARRATATKGAMASFMSALRYGEGSYGWQYKTFQKNYVHGLFVSFRMRKDQPTRSSRRKKVMSNLTIIVLTSLVSRCGLRRFLHGQDFWRTQSRPTKTHRWFLFACGVPLIAFSGLGQPKWIAQGTARAFSRTRPPQLCDYATVFHLPGYAPVDDDYYYEMVANPRASRKYGIGLTCATNSGSNGWRTTPLLGIERADAGAVERDQASGYRATPLQQALVDHRAAIQQRTSTALAESRHAPIELGNGATTRDT